MKIKTVEKMINFKALFEIIKEVVQPQFVIEPQSFVNDKNITLFALDKKSRYIQVSAFFDLEFNRTIITILVLTEKLKNSNQKIQISDKQSLYQSINHLEAIKYSKRTKIDYNELEANILKKILVKIKSEFDYKDRLLKYPFSMTPDFDDINLYARYSSFLDIIERKLIEYGINHSHIFRNYDFAKDSEIYQRIIDMIVVSDKFIKQNEDNDYMMLFFYSHKSQTNFSLIELVRLSKEINNYSKEIRKTLKSKDRDIKPVLVILSLIGVEISLLSYLRSHIYGESSHTIPIFIIPPNKSKIWHNLNEDRSLSDTLTRRKNEVKNKIRSLRMVSNTSHYGKDHIDSETKRLSELKDKITSVEKNYDLVEIFSEIFHFNTS